nr:hypothetical protein [uncultured Acetatifactor sp.]
MKEAVDQAVDACIRQGILEEFLQQNRAEVTKMSIFEYDEEKAKRLLYYKSPYAILAPRVFLRFLCAKTETAVRQNELLLLILCASPKLSDFQVWWCGWLHGSLEKMPMRTAEQIEP